MKTGFDRRAYWERKILTWERSRYGGKAWASPQSWTLRHRMRAASALALRHLPAGGHVVELGCGSGLFAERIAGRFGSYFGIDLAEAAILEAKQRLPGGNARFVQGDALSMELPPADLVVALGFLDWLEPAEAAALLPRLKARYLLLSFTREARCSPYRIYRAWYDQHFTGGAYRARSYRAAELLAWAAPGGAASSEVPPSSRFDPGRLLFIDRGTQA